MNLKLRAHLSTKIMPGLRAPAFFVAAALAGAGLIAAPMASAPAHAQAATSPVPVPSQIELAKMVWSTMLAVDHANRSGNYSVLRDMSSQGFQMNNTAATLGQVFATLRGQQVDLSQVLLVPPTFFEQPRFVAENVIQARGAFQLRPTAILFDTYFIWEQGTWKLHGIDLQATEMSETQPR